jgi:hypothetical protein
MAITQAMATSFKVEILSSYHNFNTTNPARSSNTADTFKIALFTSSATLDASTTAYSSTNEVPNGSGYTTGGNTLTISQVPTSTSTTAWLDFADTSWTTATITANGALIYNSSQSNRAVAVLAFGGDKTSTAGTFTIVFPTADSTNAIIRIA